MFLNLLPDHRSEQNEYRVSKEGVRRIQDTLCKFHQADAVLFKCRCLFHQSVRFDFLLLSL